MSLKSSVSARETLAVFEEIDAKLAEIEMREGKLVVDQRLATQTKEDGERKLNAANTILQNAEVKLDLFRQETSRKDDEYKNREATMNAKLGDLERKTNELNEDMSKREHTINQRTVTLDKLEKENKENKKVYEQLAQQHQTMAVNLNNLSSTILTSVR